MNITSLIRAGEQTKFISLDLRVAEPGESVEFAPGDERLVVILSGRAELTLDEDRPRCRGWPRRRVRRRRRCRLSASDIVGCVPGAR